MLVWLSAVIFLMGIVGTVFCLVKAARRKKSNVGTGAVVYAAAIFGVVSVLSALYLVAAVLLLGGIS
ncbi:MAG: hypothetical protein VB084_11955 [Syntrophomonadaceae bacterium]|nr:hypothetical protein [Syntrophomonadaceae bacterium]